MRPARITAIRETSTSLAQAGFGEPQVVFRGFQKYLFPARRRVVPSGRALLGLVARRQEEGEATELRLSVHSPSPSPQSFEQKILKARRLDQVSLGCIDSQSADKSVSALLRIPPQESC